MPLTGAAAGLTAYYQLDFGTLTAVTDTSATEISSTNAKGYYLFDLLAAETNGDTILYTCKSSNAAAACVAVPALVYTIPATGLLAPTVAGRTLAVDASGEVTLADGVVHGGTTATLRLGASTSTPALYVTNSGGSAAGFDSTGSNGNGISCLGNNTGAAMRLRAFGGSGAGLLCEGASGGVGIQAIGGDQSSGYGMYVQGGGHASAHGLVLESGATGRGLQVDDMTVSGTTTLSGAVSLGSTLSITGTTTFAAVNTGAVGITTLATSGTTTLNALTVTNALTVSGATTLTGAVTATNASNSITGITVAALAATGVTAVEDAVWDAVLANHLDAGSTGFALNAAGSAGDPWGTALPGAYGAGTAGFIIGTNLNATITSRMATYTQPTGFLTATFPATVASTTNITAGTITTVTNLTNAPTAGDFTAVMKTSLNAATPAVTVSDKTGFSLSATGLDAVVIETGLNARQAISLVAAALDGVLSGAGTTTITIKGAGVATTRIVATVDESGNRSAITLTPPA